MPGFRTIGLGSNLDRFRQFSEEPVIGFGWLGRFTDRFGLNLKGGILDDL